MQFKFTWFITSYDCQTCNDNFSPLFQYLVILAFNEFQLFKKKKSINTFWTLLSLNYFFIAKNSVKILLKSFSNSLNCFSYIYNNNIILYINKIIKYFLKVY